MAKAAKSDTDKSDAKNPMLDTLIQQIQKQFGEGSIMRMGEAELKSGIDVISTGALPLTSLSIAQTPMF